MVYYANGGFNWHDVYFMPIKLRDFYWKELLKAKEEEKEQINKVNNSTNKSNSSKTRRM
jgi:hypothetical protein